MDEIIVNLERVSRMIRSAEFSGGLNPAQWEALRYLSRCNRLSNSPLALAKYLGATKGTVSQTLTALARKGLIERSAREGNARSIALKVTPLGLERLKSDPWAALQQTIDDLPKKVRRRMAQGLEALRDDELRRRGGPTFGTCRNCRFYQDAEPAFDTPAHCRFADLPLSEPESGQLCIEYVPR